jgi:hypothetical protein
MSVVAVSKVLRERLSDEGVEEFIKILSTVEEGARKDSLAILEERFERRLVEEISGVNLKIESLRAEIASTSQSLHAEIASTGQSLRAEIASNSQSLRAEIASNSQSLRAEMMSFKAEIIKWMFLFWIGQMVVMGGMIAGLVKMIK